MSPLILVILVSSVFAVALAGIWLRSRYEWAEPNQWLIHIRRGRPIQTGIGIRCWRLPGDTVARFTSTMQRVTFDTEVYTQDKQLIQVDGFLLWAVSDKEGAPFQAFSRLGIAHRDAKIHPTPESHHALSRPQHHAFRKSVEAVIRKSAVQFPLRDLLSAPGSLAQHIHQSMTDTVEGWGIRLDAVEINELHVSQKELFDHLQAPYIEQSRQEAEQVRLASEAQLAELRLEQSKTTALKEAETRREQELEMARITLEQERESKRVWEEQQQLAQQKAAQERQWQEEAAIERHQLELAAHKRQEDIRKEQEQQEQLIAQLQEERRHAIHEAQLQRQAREQQMEREHLEALFALEQTKPEALRQAELTKHLVESASDALQALPLQEIRWLSSTAEQGPAGLMLGLVDTLQQIAQTKFASTESTYKATQED
jgi:hypothetical protein